MRWRRVDPLQPVSALLAVGDEVVAEARARLAGKSALFQTMRRVEGEGWMALFAARVGGDEAGDPLTILPSISVMMPLYEDAPGWWLPVGTAMAAPIALQPELREAMAKARNIKPPLILVPRFDGQPTANIADIYKLV